MPVTGEFHAPKLAGAFDRDLRQLLFLCAGRGIKNLILGITQRDATAFDFQIHGILRNIKPDLRETGFPRPEKAVLKRNARGHRRIALKLECRFFQSRDHANLINSGFGEFAAKHSDLGGPTGILSGCLYFGGVSFVGFDSLRFDVSFASAIQVLTQKQFVRWIEKPERNQVAIFLGLPAQSHGQLLRLC